MNPRHRRLLIPGLLVALLVVVVLVSLGRRADAVEGSGAVVSTIDDPRITESSGLVLSLAHDDLAYTVNDSDNDPVVYAVEVSTGDVVGTTRVTGGDLRDTEALAMGGDGTLWIADTGDNLEQRSDVAVYTLPEPGRGDHTVRATRFPIAYDGGPVDVETLLVDPTSGAAYLVSKGLLGGEVYTLPDPLVAGRTNRAAASSIDAPLLTTDGAFSPDGALVVLRTYVAAHAYDRDFAELGRQTLPVQPQGETLAFEPSGTSVLVGSEGTASELVRVRLVVDGAVTTATVDPTSAPTAAATPPPSEFDEPGDSGFAGATFAFAGLAVAALVGLLALLSRRPRR